MSKTVKRALNAVAAGAENPKDFVKKILAEAKRVGFDMNDEEAMIDSGARYGFRVTKALADLVCVCNEIDNSTRKPTKKLLARYDLAMTTAEDVLATPFGVSAPSTLQ